MIRIFEKAVVLVAVFLGVQLEQRAVHAKKVGTHTLNYVKASVDVIVAFGLLQLAPKTVTPRVTGALGFITSVIALYQVRNFLFIYYLLFIIFLMM